MIDTLIQAYRAQIFDFHFTDLLFILTRKWKSLIICLLCVVGIISAVGCSIYFNLPVIMYITIMVELILCMVADRYFVKQFRSALVSKTSRIENVTTLLQTVLPDQSLYTKVHVEALIERLSERIALRPPFRSFMQHLSSFGKWIIVPVITYVAGVYSSSLQTLAAEVVVVYALAVIIISAILYALCLFLSSVIRRITNRDYDAAMALCEDLKDIKLLHFSTLDVSC